MVELFMKKSLTFLSSDDIGFWYCYIYRNISNNKTTAWIMIGYSISSVLNSGADLLIFQLCKNWCIRTIPADSPPWIPYCFLTQNSCGRWFIGCCSLDYLLIFCIVGLLAFDCLFYHEAICFICQGMRCLLLVSRSHCEIGSLFVLLSLFIAVFFILSGIYWEFIRNPCISSTIFHLNLGFFTLANLFSSCSLQLFPHRR